MRYITFILVVLILSASSAYYSVSFGASEEEDIPTQITFQVATVSAPVSTEIAISAPEPLLLEESIEKEVENIDEQSIRIVPFYSQFDDISDPDWKKRGCGIASLAMVIDFYSTQTIVVDSLLQEGIESGAYLNGAGWIHRDLAHLSRNYGLDGTNYDLSANSMEYAYSELSKALDEGPVIASVYYTFTPGHPIPHLVVINAIDNGMVYYNDPAEESGNGSLSEEAFQAAWKKRYIEVRPS